MTNDETMARIEAALDEFADHHRDLWQARSYDPRDAQRTDEARTRLLALIREALPKPDAEHEAAALVCPQCRSGRDVEQTCMGILSGYDANRATCRACKRTGIVDDWKLIEQARRARPADAERRSPLELEGLGAGIDHRDPGGWGEDDDRFHRNERDKAAAELLRAAGEAWPWVYGHPKQSDELWQAIEAAKRAGIGQHPSRPSDN